jgi:orotate phosphoribosyltransferase/AMMECR1 domain-containing protein
MRSREGRNVAIVGHREELRQLLQREGLLFRGEHQQLKSRKGRNMPWMLYSWAVSLQGQGARLAGLCLLDKLKSFESTQLASHGYAAIPLVSSCVLLGEGRYQGLVIREARKSYGACRQIEGIGDRSKPVVVIDDCLVSGTSLYKAISVLEGEGYRVEGAVCLVHIPWQGGSTWAAGLGYRVDAVFDAWQDLEIEAPVFPFGLPLHPLNWDTGAVIASGLSPTSAARQIATAYLLSGVPPLPPAQLANAYEEVGGAFVSFRHRHTGEDVAWDGFVQLHGGATDCGTALTISTLKAMQRNKDAVARCGISNLAVSVSFLKDIERVTPRQLDCGEYGILVHSDRHAWKVGIASSDARGHASEIAQLTEACTKAGLYSGEPYTLYRYQQLTLPEESRLGNPRESHLSRRVQKFANNAGPTLTSCVRAILRDQNSEGQGAYRDLCDSELIAPPIAGLAVTLYHHGTVGCYVAWGNDLIDCLERATIGAWHDDRYARRRAGLSMDDVDIVVAILHRAHVFENMTAKTVSGQFRLGLDTLTVRQDDRFGAILAFFPCHYDWEPSRTVQEVMAKAQAVDTPSVWATYTTTAWLERNRRVYPLVDGYPEPDGASKEIDDLQLINFIGGYIARQITDGPLPKYCYYPVYEKTIDSGTLDRAILALLALIELSDFSADHELRELASRGVVFCLERLDRTGGNLDLRIPGWSWNPGAQCYLLSAISRLDAQTLASSHSLALAEHVETFFRNDGTISSTPGFARIGVDHDILPGAALVALADFVSATRQSDYLNHERLQASLHWYRSRFRTLHPWLMAGWQMQAWTAIHALSNAEDHASFVFEIADWTLDRQLDKNGAFLTDLCLTGPSFHTACIAEGIADAWALANRLGETTRSAAYAAAWRAAMRFMRRLVILDESTFCLRNPDRARGGVRHSRTSSAVRIDYPAHLLLALLKGQRVAVGAR